MLVGVLALTETVSWGVLYYAFAVFLTPMERELGWTRAELTGAFSAALLVSALAAIPIGRLLDRASPRPVMTAGSLVGALLVLAWSRVSDLVSFYLIWMGIGVVMAAVLYEPAFAVIAKWFFYQRRRALTLLTLFAAVSSFIFSPLANWLIGAQGWRAALVSLAAILAATTVPLHGVFLRRPPHVASAARDEPAGPVVVELREQHIPVGAAVRSRSFWLLTSAFVLSSFSTSAIGVHLIPYLLGAGYSGSFAAAAAGLLGLMQIPGRLLFAVMDRAAPHGAEAPAAFLLQGSALLVLITGSGPAAVVAAVTLFGMGNGMATLVRATAIADAFGSRYYGSIAGIAASCAIAARAVAPVVAAGAYIAFHGYAMLLWLLVALSALAALAACLARRHPLMDSPVYAP